MNQPALRVAEALEHIERYKLHEQCRPPQPPPPTWTRFMAPTVPETHMEMARTYLRCFAAAAPENTSLLTQTIVNQAASRLPVPLAHPFALCGG